jgi:hypothetical protein
MGWRVFQKTSVLKKDKNLKHNRSPVRREKQSLTPIRIKNCLQVIHFFLHNQIFTFFSFFYVLQKNMQAKIARLLLYKARFFLNKKYPACLRKQDILCLLLFFLLIYHQKQLFYLSVASFAP